MLSDQPDSAAGPCAGLRVVDMTALVSGPFCTQVLADLGAEVIRVEGPTSDVMRVSTPLFRGHAAGFEQNNRGKKSVVVDVKSDGGRQAVRALADTADLFVQNSRPGVMERLGLGYETLRPTNPRLIYLSINGFGEIGPYKDRPAYDTVIQGLTGFMPVQGREGKPEAMLSPVADKATAVYAANAALAALLHRERTGEGQKVVVNMLSAFAAFMLPDPLTSYTFQSTDPMPSVTHAGVFEPLAVTDGYVVGLILQRRQFERLCVALGREELLQDPRFEKESQLLDNVRLMYAELEVVTRTMSSAAFLELAAQASVPFGRVNTLADLFEDPHAKATELYVDFEDPEFGVIRHLGFPATFEHWRPDVRRRAPKLGEHTEEVLGALEEGAADTSPERAKT